MPLGLEEADKAEKGAIRAAVTKRSRMKMKARNKGTYSSEPEYDAPRIKLSPLVSFGPCRKLADSEIITVSARHFCMLPPSICPHPYLGLV